MNLNYATPNQVPEAYVAINKSRIKSYNDIRPETSVYYLSDKTEFQLELFNPTQETLLAKIKLNDKNISQGGLVLKPGQRIFLERYLDVSKKFLFETYEVDNDNSQVKEAIKNNGAITVEFFKETYINSNFNYLPWTNGGFFPNHSNFNTNVVNLNHTFESNLTNINNNVVGSYVNKFPSNFNNSSRSLSLNKKSINSKSIETGSIEMGGNSNQKFTSVDKEFSIFPFHTVNSKILPLSQKINEFSEVIKLAKYCTSCGYKVHYKDKFCGQCGNKL